MCEQPNPLDYFTPELHQKFTCEITRLQAWYLWWLTQKEKKPFEEMLISQTYMFPRIYRNSDSEWEALQEEMHSLYLAQGDNPDTHDLEEWVLEKSLPAITTHAPDLYQKQWVAGFQGSKAGFSYNFRQKEAGEVAYLHFRNVFIPESPFTYREELKAGLAATIQKISEEKPDLQRILMGTWLNDIEPFASLFPPKWRESAVYEKPANHLGWWGQFMDKAGRLHQRNAEQFRKIGKFPFKYMLCECSMDVFKKHFGLE